MIHFKDTVGHLVVRAVNKSGFNSHHVQIKRQKDGTWLWHVRRPLEFRWHSGTALSCDGAMRQVEEVMGVKTP